ncbi:MAG: dehypoxanthine futalosine cyclase [Bacteroidetes bacterium GWA2_30_7]|nr:MAG: dehypoxanthine futalosine cyclase [Bacteroidetes bacterium GWA2_30_7]
MNKASLNKIYQKALNLEFLSVGEAFELYKTAPLSDLIYIANEIRKIKHPENIVTWIIDRNINITNACIARCKFCNFHKKPDDEGIYITTIEEYKQKIEELYKVGGNQILLQGGLSPDLGIDYYEELFRKLKQLFPDLKLHALGPPEIVFLSKKGKKSITEVLKRLINAGLDSLPGAGAEILCDRVRSELSKGKCKASEWLEVMRQAHILNMPTSATMMFGHIETLEERIEHLFKIRDLQVEKPENNYGFLSFIPWPFQDEGTLLNTSQGVYNTISPSDYVRFIAISRIILVNVANIQASWLTVGISTAQVCLHAGANDFGSIMIEENVVSSAGANYNLNAQQMQTAITEAGFIPKLRNQKFEILVF